MTSITFRKTKQSRAESNKAVAKLVKAKQAEPTPVQIIDAICRYYGVARSDVSGGGAIRNGVVPHARRAIYTILRKRFGWRMSDAQIAELSGIRKARRIGDTLAEHEQQAIERFLLELYGDRVRVEFEDSSKTKGATQ